MRRAADSSVVVAALLADHEAHETSQQALALADATIAHVAIETYAVLTRLPAPLTLDARTACSLVAARLPEPYLTLDADGAPGALARLADAGVRGGATYDGWIALSAVAHELEVLSRDARAARTYRALGARFSLLDG